MASALFTNFSADLSTDLYTDFSASFSAYFPTIFSIDWFLPLIFSSICPLIFPLINLPRLQPYLGANKVYFRLVLKTFHWTVHWPVASGKTWTTSTWRWLRVFIPFFVECWNAKNFADPISNKNTTRCQIMIAPLKASTAGWGTFSSFWPNFSRLSFSDWIFIIVSAHFYIYLHIPYSRKI